MSLRIDRLDISLSGTPATARRFARALQAELSRIEIAPGTAARIERITALNLTARPGESPSRLAARVAQAITAAANGGDPR